MQHGTTPFPADASAEPSGSAAPGEPPDHRAGAPIPPPLPRRLTRSSRERLWAGVAGGLGEYFDVDPTLVRLVWIAAAVFTAGLAIPVYILLWFIMPEDATSLGGGPHGWGHWPPRGPAAPAAYEEEPGAAGFGGGPEDARAAEEAAHTRQPADFLGAGPPPPRLEHRHLTRRQRSAGVVLVSLGILVLAGNMGLFHLVRWDIVWPLVLVALGVALLTRHGDCRH